MIDQYGCAVSPSSLGPNPQELYDERDRINKFLEEHPEYYKRPVHDQPVLARLYWLQLEIKSHEDLETMIELGA